MTRRRPLAPATTVAAPSEWDRFVDRRGSLTAAALMVAILALTAARLHPTPVTRALAAPQLLLLLVVLGCIAVLSYRSDAS